MHLEMRILLQILGRDERGTLAQAQTLFRAAVAALAPPRLDQVGEPLVAGAGAQRAAQVGAVQGVETEVPDAVRREAAAIAGTAEGRRGRRDDAEDRTVRQREAVGGGGGVLLQRRDGTVLMLQALEDLGTGDDPLLRPVRRTADVHVLD